MDLLILYGGRYAPVIINPINIKFSKSIKILPIVIEMDTN